MMVQEALRTKELSKSFGGVRALRGVGISIKAGEQIGLIGPNGSGKSTFVNCVTGYYTPDSGRVTYFDQDITGFPPHKIFRMGVGRTFQTTRLYWNLSCLQNLRISSLWLSADSAGRVGARTEEVLSLLKLTSKKDTKASLLSLFDQKKLEIATRLITSPTLLLLDEPAAGLSQEEMNDLIEVFRILRQKGLAILVIEHTMRVIFSIADRVIVLNEGSIIADGRPAEILSNSAVIEAYVGSWRPSA